MKANQALRLIDRHSIIAPLALIVVALVVVGFGTMRSDPVLLSRSEVSANVKPGERLTVRRYGRWLRRDCTGYTHQFIIVDSLGYPHAPVSEQLGDIGAVSSIQREVQIPFTIAWGNATIKSRMQFYCFPFYRLWPIQMEHKPIAFHISPP